MRSVSAALAFTFFFYQIRFIDFILIHLVALYYPKHKRSITVKHNILIFVIQRYMFRWAETFGVNDKYWWVVFDCNTSFMFDLMTRWVWSYKQFMGYEERTACE